MSDADANQETTIVSTKIEEGSSQDDTKPAGVELFDKNIISKIWAFIDAEKQFAPLKDINFPDVHDAVDFSKMKKKSYDGFDQFVEDIEQFDQNCRTQKQSVQKASKELINYVNEQIHLIKACKKCFENAYECGKKSVTMQCSNQHLLLWVKMYGYSGYWPAKLMIVNAEEKTVLVRFFGDHSKSILSAGQCFLYSKQPPDTKSVHQKSYQKAVEDANEYAKCMQFEFGHFNYAKPHVTFDPAKFAIYLKQMIASRYELNADADIYFNWNDSTENSDSNVHDNDGNSTTSATGSIDTNIDTEMGLAIDKKSQTPARKRSTKTPSIDCGPLKKVRSEIGADKATDLITQGMKYFNQLNDDKTEQINKLKRKLDSTKNERDDLKRKNSKLADEKALLELERAASELKREDEKHAWEEEKKALMDRNAALEKELENEKQKHNDKDRVLMGAIEAFDLNKSKILEVMKK